MNWKTYCREFTKQAKAQHLHPTIVEAALDYAFQLHAINLPVIFDINHLSLLVGYSSEYLLRATNCTTGAFYRTFHIKKKSGGTRVIQEPLPSLKEIQRWLLDNIFSKMPISKYAKGFVLGRSIKENARFHQRQEMVLSLDIKDFFPSISSAHIYNILHNVGYAPSVAKAIEMLCSVNGILPQGAPTSPCVSNIYMLHADNRISLLSSKNKTRYTRYADDITISGHFKPGQMIRSIENILGDYGLDINHNKTRLMRSHQRQEVTGVTVNSFMQAPKEYRRKLRQEIYYIKRYGLAGHISRTNDTKANYIKHLMGTANHILNINPNDKDALESITFLRNLYSK